MHGLTLWYIGLGLKKYLNYHTGVRLILWNIGLGLTLKSLDYLTELVLILSYSGLELKKWIDQEEMPLEKYEDFLELSAKQFIIESSPVSLG